MKPLELVRMAREVMGPTMHLGDCSEERPCIACAKVAASFEIVAMTAAGWRREGRMPRVCRGCQVQQQGLPPSGSAVPIFLSGRADALEANGAIEELCPEHTEDLARARRIAAAIAKIRATEGAS